MPTCVKCGQTLEPNMKFCGKCGAKVEEKPQLQTQVPPPAAKVAKPFPTEIILCPKCQSENSWTKMRCDVCGALLKKQPLMVSQPAIEKTVDKSGDYSKFSTSYASFNTLKSLGQFLQFLGGLSFVLGIIFLFKIFAGSGGSNDALIGLGMLTAIVPIVAIAGGLLLFLAGLFFVVQAESGLVLLEIEKNTRR